MYSFDIMSIFNCGINPVSTKWLHCTIKMCYLFFAMMYMHWSQSEQIKERNCVGWCAFYIIQKWAIFDWSLITVLKHCLAHMLVIPYKESAPNSELRLTAVCTISTWPGSIGLVVHNMKYLISTMPGSSVRVYLVKNI